MAPSCRRSALAALVVCAAPIPAAAATPAGSSQEAPFEHHFDCVSGFANWRAEWSPTKRAECCMRFGRACEESKDVVSDDDVDAVATLAEVLQDEKAQQDLKAEETSLPSASPPPASTLASKITPGRDERAAAMLQDPAVVERDAPHSQKFECTADTDHWALGWSDAKKAWCCQKHAVACTEPKDLDLGTAMSGSVFDCSSEYWNWRQSWSDAKQVWCCQAVGAGCPRLKARDSDGGNAAQKQAKKPSAKAEASASSHAAPGSLGGTTSLPFDCGHNLATWETAWSEGKKAWCCMREQRGCHAAQPEGEGTDSTTPTTTASKSTTTTEFAMYDCEAGFLTLHLSWSESKRHWCCKTEKRGCTHSDADSDDYDCAVDLKNWLTMWDVAKRTYCCQHEASLSDHAMCFTSLKKFEVTDGSIAGADRATSSSSARLTEALRALGIFGAGACVMVSLFVLAARSWKRQRVDERTALLIRVEGLE